MTLISGEISGGRGRKTMNLLTRRLLGIGFIVLSFALVLFLWVVAGPHVLVVASTSGLLLLIFGALVLSGWPWPTNKGK
jgi:hypothetical protein